MDATTTPTTGYTVNQLIAALIEHRDAHGRGDHLVRLLPLGNRHANRYSTALVARLPDDQGDVVGIWMSRTPQRHQLAGEPPVTGR